MEFIRLGKDLNMLALTDIEAMKLSNLLAQYRDFSSQGGKGTHARRVLAADIDKAIQEAIQ